MEIKLGVGIGPLKFGFSEEEVCASFGLPDRVIDLPDDPDEENRIHWLYNDQRICLTFYRSEERRLGYVESSNQELTINGFSVIGTKVNQVMDMIEEISSDDWDVQSIPPITVLYFNEQYWVQLGSNYERVTEVSFGVPFLDDENYNWPE